MDAFVFGHRGVGAFQRHLDSIPLGDAVAQFQGLCKLVARVEVEDERAGGQLGQPMEDHAPFRPKGGGHREAIAIPPGRPQDDLGGFGILQQAVCRGEFRQQGGRHVRPLEIDDVQAHAAGRFLEPGSWNQRGILRMFPKQVNNRLW